MYANVQRCKEDSQKTGEQVRLLSRKFRVHCAGLNLQHTSVLAAHIRSCSTLPFLQHTSVLAAHFCSSSTLPFLQHTSVQQLTMALACLLLCLASLLR